MKGLLKKLSILVMLFTSQAFAQYAAPTAPGKAIYDKWCTPCHAPDAAGHYPGTVALQVKYNGTLPAALEERTDLTAEIITTFIRKGVSIMPMFRKTEISDSELQVLIDYLSP